MTPQAAPAGLADITSEKEADLLGQNFERVLHSALTLPGVRVDRDTYLRTELRKHGVAEEIIARAIAASPVKAGIDPKTMDAIAASAIKVEVGRTTALSTLAGLPGGLAMIGTIPADLTQYFGHVMRLEQKLAYAYGWPAFVSEEGNIDDETFARFVVLLGVIMGVGGATAAVTEFAKQPARIGVEKAIQKVALTKTWWYSPMKSILRVVGVKVTKDTFAKSVSKFVPVVGGLVSGGLTYATFRPGAKSLQKYLASLPAATGLPENETTGKEIVIEEVDIIEHPAN